MFRHLLDFWYIQARLARINYWYVLAFIAAGIFGWNAFEDWRIARMDYEGAVEAHHEEDYDTAFPVFQRLANEGDAASQYALGIMYRDGQGTRRSLSTAADWFLKAAQQGEVWAMTSLADALSEIYRSPNGGRPEDLALATDWYRQAAEAGNMYGQRRFGLALIAGEGIEIDRDAGLSWLMRAIDGGNSYAMVSLGVVYEHGALGETDLDLALHWYLRAARRGQLNGVRWAMDLLEDEQSPVFDLEKAYLWAMIGRHWWRDEPITANAFSNQAVMFSRVRPDVGPGPEITLVHMGLMDWETYLEQDRAHREALGTPETWPLRLDEESHLRAEAQAGAIIARWPEPPIDDDAPL